MCFRETKSKNQEVIEAGKFEHKKFMETRS